jgi:hypothetical protein
MAAAMPSTSATLASTIGSVVRISNRSVFRIPEAYMRALLDSPAMER